MDNLNELATDRPHIEPAPDSIVHLVADAERLRCSREQARAGKGRTLEQILLDAQSRNGDPKA